MNFLKILREFLWLKFREFFMTNDRNLMHKYGMSFTAVQIIHGLRGIFGFIAYTYLCYHICFLWTWMSDWNELHWIAQILASMTMVTATLVVLALIIVAISKIVEGLKVFFRHFPYMISKNWDKAEREAVIRAMRHKEKKTKKKKAKNGNK